MQLSFLNFGFIVPQKPAFVKWVFQSFLSLCKLHKKYNKKQKEGWQNIYVLECSS